MIKAEMAHDAAKVAFARVDMRLVTTLPPWKPLGQRVTTRVNTKSRRLTPSLQAAAHNLSLSSPKQRMSARHVGPR